MPTFDCVIFDMDGVLADTTPCHTLAYQTLWREIGVEGPDYSEIAGVSTPDVVRRVAASLGPSAEQIAEWTERKRQLARELIREAPIGFDDAREWLPELASAGVTMAVATGASRETADLVLETTGLRRFFRTVVGGQDVARGKPHPEMMLRCLDACGAVPERALVVEDGAAGIEAAFAAGAWAACVRTGLRFEQVRFLGAFDDLRALRGAAVFGRAPRDATVVEGPCGER